MGTQQYVIKGEPIDHFQQQMQLRASDHQMSWQFQPAPMTHQVPWQHLGFTPDNYDQQCWNSPSVYGQQHVVHTYHHTYHHDQPHTPQQRPIADQKPVTADVPPVIDHEPITDDLQSVTDQHVHGKQEDAKNTQFQQPGTSDAQFHPNTQSDAQLLDHDDPPSEAEEVELQENPIASVSHVNTHRKMKMVDITYDQLSNDDGSTLEASALSKKPKVSSTRTLRPKKISIQYVDVKDEMDDTEKSDDETMRVTERKPLKGKKQRGCQEDSNNTQFQQPGYIRCTTSSKYTV